MQLPSTKHTYHQAHTYTTTNTACHACHHFETVPKLFILKPLYQT